MDYKLDAVPGREFGSVFLTPQNENLALSVVAAGWSKVRQIWQYWSCLTQKYCDVTHIGPLRAQVHVWPPVCSANVLLF